LSGLTRLPKLFRARGANSFPGESLPEDDEGLSDLSVGPMNRDMTLVRCTTLKYEGGDASARDVGDLFETAALMPNNMTCNGIRNDAGHLEMVGLSLRRDVLSKGG
jgi:hypothetical protein